MLRLSLCQQRVSLSPEKYLEKANNSSVPLKLQRELHSQSYQKGFVDGSASCACKSCAYMAAVAQLHAVLQPPTLQLRLVFVHSHLHLAASMQIQRVGVVPAQVLPREVHRRTFVAHVCKRTIQHIWSISTFIAIKIEGSA